MHGRDGVYQTPWALSETCLLASYSWTPQPTGTGGGGNSAGFAVYLIDAYGNKELIARDPLLSCSFAIPLRRRPRPPVLIGKAAPAKPHATCYVTDVYDGSGDARPGRVLVSCSNRLSGSEVSKPRQFGSHPSRLIEVLRSDPNHRKRFHLSEAEWLAIVTWVDTNAPYYDTFYDRRPPGGGEPVRNVLLDLPAPFAPAADWGTPDVLTVPRRYFDDTAGRVPVDMEGRK